MDPDPPPSAPRQVRFPPRAPRRRPPKPVPAKIESAAEDDGGDQAAQQNLLRKVNDRLKRKPKAEKTSPEQVAFSHGVASASIRTFGKQKEKVDDRSDSAKPNETHDDMPKLVTSISTAGTGPDENSTGSTNALVVKKKTEYREPWDYQHSYYPTTLPWRRPYSGDPELLDKAEFENAPEYEEDSLSSASHLGLLDKDDTRRMIFFQLPSNLPIGSSRPSRVSKGKEIAGSSTNRESVYPSKKVCSLEELPEGYMGKMLVYKSGTVKLKLGDILYDVSPGSDCMFSQSVAAINTANKHCCELGELNKRAVVAPDIDSLVGNVIDLGVSLHCPTAI